MSEQTVVTAPPPPTPSPPEAERGLPNWVVQLMVSLSAIVLALLVGAVLIIIGDDDVHASASYFFASPWDTISAALSAVGEAYKALLVGAVGSFNAIAESLTQATPLICGGLAVSLAFRTGLFNIGAQGQLIIGAMFAAWVGFTWHLPVVLHLVIAILAGIIGGAIWGGFVGLLKARTGAHEVIVTIMLNYVAYLILNWLASSQSMFRDPSASLPRTREALPDAQLPIMIPDTKAHLGYLVALGTVFAIWFLLFRTTLGFEIRTVGILSLIHI